MSKTEKALEQFSLKGKIAFVSGAAGLYGQAIMNALAEAGATVLIGSRDLKNLKQVANAGQNRGLDIEAFTYDQGSTASIVKLGKAIRKKYDHLDILVNNAAARPMKSFNDPITTFAESMKTNATGLFALTRELAEMMTKHQSGSIINIGSIQGMVGPDATLYRGLNMDGFIPDYFFHKGGMVNLTRFLAAYYGPHGIRCNCLSPGGVLSERMPAKFVERYSDKTLLGRPAHLQDIQGAIVFLASDASSYITGVNLPVDGGYTAK
jgi:NAD(P)-dependent dehydrogenase (short-subunit alcohol dehydrogenase family)